MNLRAGQTPGRVRKLGIVADLVLVCAGLHAAQAGSGQVLRACCGAVGAQGLREGIIFE